MKPFSLTHSYADGPQTTKQMQVCHAYLKSIAIAQPTQCWPRAGGKAAQRWRCRPSNEIVSYLNLI